MARKPKDTHEIALRRKNMSPFGKFIRANYVGWLFDLPLFLGLLIFTFIPMGLSFWYSFNYIDASFSFDFVGIEN